MRWRYRGIVPLSNFLGHSENNDRFTKSTLNKTTWSTFIFINRSRVRYGQYTFAAAVLRVSSRFSASLAIIWTASPLPAVARGAAPPLARMDRHVGRPNSPSPCESSRFCWCVYVFACLGNDSVLFRKVIFHRETTRKDTLKSSGNQ